MLLDPHWDIEHLGARSTSELKPLVRDLFDSLRKDYKDPEALQEYLSRVDQRARAVLQTVLEGLGMEEQNRLTEFLDSFRPTFECAW